MLKDRVIVIGKNSVNHVLYSSVSLSICRNHFSVELLADKLFNIVCMRELDELINIAHNDLLSAGIRAHMFS